MRRRTRFAAPRCGMPVNLPDDGEKQEDSDLLSFRQGETFGGPPAGAAAA